MIENMLFRARADNAQVGLGACELDARAELDKVAEYFEAVAADRDVTVAVSGAAKGHGGPHAAAARHHQPARQRPAPRAGRQHRARGGGARPAGVPRHPRGPTPARPIAPESLPHLFGRFYRADPSRRNSAASTGLGLAIVDTIMRLHGGSVIVRSDEVQTEFEIDLPLRG